MNPCFICRQPHWGKRGHKSVLLDAMAAPTLACWHREPELLEMWPRAQQERKQTTRVVEIEKRKAVSA